MARTSVEIAAYSVDEAVRLALEELQLTVDAVDIDILSDAGPDEDAEALVRVTAKGHASQPEQSAPKPSNGYQSQRPSRDGQRRDRPQPESRDRDRLSGRRGPGDRPSQRGTPPQASNVERVDAADEQIAKDIVRELLGHMGIRAEVMAVDNPSTVPLSVDEPQTIFIDVLGQDLGMLIGRRGDHLSQIQYLVTMLVNRKVDTWTRVIVDVEGYRNRREESLVGLAERIARQVSRSHRAIDLEPMPPNERRIIHLTLQEHPDVQTHSTGEGHQRRITVEPRSSV
ncbi:MAG: RNA-binding cell elongation regulator Jag/EloR [Thermomicrobiales bacterium]